MSTESYRPRQDISTGDPDPVTSSSQAGPATSPWAPNKPQPQVLCTDSLAHQGASLLPTHMASMHPNTQYLVLLWHHRGLEGTLTPHNTEAKGPPAPGTQPPWVQGEVCSLLPQLGPVCSPLQQAPRTSPQTQGCPQHPFPSACHLLIVGFFVFLDCGGTMDAAFMSPGPGF